MATDVAAVIGNYQGERLLPDCLSSLRAQSHAPIEIIVVDGASRDASIAVAEAAGAQVLSCANNGLGYLYNRGAAATEAPYVLFLNNDVALEPTCIEQLAAALDLNTTRFAADPRQLDWEGGRTIHARTTLTRGGLFREYFPGLHLDPNVQADGVVDTISAHGAAMLVRRELHMALGGFDETFFLEWEDLDLCWRAWLRGWSSVYVSDAVVRHHVGGATTPEVAPRRSESSHQNLLRFALKCLPATAAATVLVGELARLPAHPRAITRAAVTLVGDTADVLRQRRSLRPHGPTFAQLLALGRPS